MRYILLLRGINVGGKHMVSMVDLKDNLTAKGFTMVQSYINSGNLFFDAKSSLQETSLLVKKILDEYDFEIPFVLLTKEEYRQLKQDLPDWWHEDLARRDVLFIIDPNEVSKVKASVEAMDLHNEKVHFSNTVIFWGKLDEDEFLKTAYHKELIKMDYYKRITIRNGKTFDKITDFL